MSNLGFTLASSVVAVATLIGFGAFRRAQKGSSDLTTPSTLSDQGLYEVQQLQAENSRLAAICEQNRQSLNDLQQHNESLQYSLKAAQAEAESLTQQLDLLNTASHELAETQQQQTTLTEEVSQLSQCNQQLESDLARQRADFESALAQQQTTLTATEQQIQSLTQEKDALTTALEAANAALAEQTTAADTWRHRIEVLTQEKDALTQEKDALTQEKDALTTSLTVANGYLAEQTSAVDSLGRTVDVLTQEKATFQEAIKISQAVVESLQQEMSRLTAENQRLTTSEPTTPQLSIDPPSPELTTAAADFISEGTPTLDVFESEDVQPSAANPNLYPEVTRPEDSSEVDDIELRAVEAAIAQQLDPDIV